MIEIMNGQLHLHDVFIEDRDVVQFFSSLEADKIGAVEEARYDTLVRALKIGVAAIQRAQTQVDIDVIRREFEQLQQQVNSALDAVFHEDNGQLSLALKDYLGKDGKLAGLLTENITGDGSNFRRLLDYTENESPLQKLFTAFDKKLKEVDDRLVDIQKQVAEQKGRALEREHGTFQGFDFEIVLKNILNDLARPYKDVVLPVGSLAEDGGSKKGDFLIEINPKDTDGQKVSIVIEAKRQAKAVMGKTGILEEIDAAQKNRQAQFAIAVFSEDSCPSEVGSLRGYGTNRLICAIPADGSNRLALELAYSLARTEVCWQTRHQSSDYDKAKVAESIIQIQEKLKRFQGIKSKATTLSNTASELRSELDNLEDEIRNSTKTALKELHTVPTA